MGVRDFELIKNMQPNDFEKPNNLEQEKSSRLGNLLNIKAHLESIQEQELEKSTDADYLINLIFLLEESKLLDLAERVKNEMFPKSILISAEKAMIVLDSGNIFKAYDIFGHEVRKGAAYLLKSSPSSQNVCLLALELCINFASLLKDYSLAEGICKFDLKDNERAVQLHKLKEESSDDELDIFNNIRMHEQEIIEGVKKAHSEFLESTKDLAESDADLEEIYKEISEVVEEKIAELS